MIKVEVRGETQSHLCEAGQTTGLRLALLHKVKAGVFHTITPLIRCRDYFNDALYAQYSEARKIHPIYGFHWEYSSNFATQCKLNTLHILGNIDKKLYKDYSALHKVEDMLGFKKTVMHEVEITKVNCSHTSKEQPDWCVYQIDIRWVSNPIMFSLYTQILRMLEYGGKSIEEIIETTGFNDGTDSNFSELFKDKKLPFFLANWQEITPMWEPHAETSNNPGTSAHVSNIHNGGGILSFFTGIGYDEIDASEPACRTWVTNFHNLYNKDKVKEAA